jgi:hypothetical protein
MKLDLGNFGDAVALWVAADGLQIQHNIAGQHGA